MWGLADPMSGPEDMLTWGDNGAGGPGDDQGENRPLLRVVEPDEVPGERDVAYALSPEAEQELCHRCREYRLNLLKGASERAQIGRADVISADHIVGRAIQMGGGSGRTPLQTVSAALGAALIGAAITLVVGALLGSPHGLEQAVAATAFTLAGGSLVLYGK